MQSKKSIIQNAFANQRIVPSKITPNFKILITQYCVLLFEPFYPFENQKNETFENQTQDISLRAILSFWRVKELRE